MRIGACILTLSLPVAPAICQTPPPEPLAAYSSGSSVVLVSKTGKVVSTVRLPVRVGEFTFSPDLKEIVVISRHPHDESGGKMYLYSLESKQTQRIPAHALEPGATRSEVYSEPQFSADGTKLFFNTHPQADGDLGETLGPIAEFDLEPSHARTLEWTIGLITDGFLLSPSGREFLLWDEGKVTNANGATVFDVHDFELEAPFKWAFDIAWIGNSCVLYRAGKQTNPYIKDEVSFFVLDLKSLKSASAFKTIGLSDKDLDGLVCYRYPYAIVKRPADIAGDHRPEYFLVSPGGMRTKLTSGDATAFEILLNRLMDDVPSGCK